MCPFSFKLARLITWWWIMGRKIQNREAGGLKPLRKKNPKNIWPRSFLHRPFLFGSRSISPGFKAVWVLWALFTPKQFQCWFRASKLVNLEPFFFCFQQRKKWLLAMEKKVPEWQHFFAGPEVESAKVKGWDWWKEQDWAKRHFLKEAYVREVMHPIKQWLNNLKKVKTRGRPQRNPQFLLHHTKQ